MGVSLPPSVESLFPVVPVMRISLVRTQNGVAAAVYKRLRRLVVHRRTVSRPEVIMKNFFSFKESKGEIVIIRHPRISDFSPTCQFCTAKRLQQTPELCAVSKVIMRVLREIAHANCDVRLTR